MLHTSTWTIWLAFEVQAPSPKRSDPEFGRKGLAINHALRTMNILPAGYLGEENVPKKIIPRHDARVSTLVPFPV